MTEQEIARELLKGFDIVPEGTEFGKHIEFEPGLDKPKTKTWKVLSKYDSSMLGWIGWFSRWRKYSFFPSNSTVFEEDCLRDIAMFVQHKTQEHKLKK
jgi:hypothetical protein